MLIGISLLFLLGVKLGTLRCSWCSTGVFGSSCY
jgi:hypothetical protein